jgi:hypothetical protein
VRHLLYLLPGLPVLLAGSLLSYRKDLHGRSWYLAVMVGLGSAAAFIYAVACRKAPDARRVYELNLAWDSAMVVTYYLLPLVFIGSELSRAQWACVAGIIGCSVTFIALGK